MCNYLGTLGSLISLVRESVGPVDHKTAIIRKDWPLDKANSIIDLGMKIEDVLPFAKYKLNAKQTLAFKNGAFLRPLEMELSHESKMSDIYFWMLDENNQLLGLGEKTFPNELKVKINFHSEGQAGPSSDHTPE
jgi:hypothetical protein